MILMLQRRCVKKRLEQIKNRIQNNSMLAAERYLTYNTKK